MTLDLDELERKAKSHATYPYTPHVHEQALERACRETPFVVLALIERVRELERVAKSVHGITKDVAENGRLADAPYVSEEEARELLAIIERRWTDA